MDDKYTEGLDEQECVKIQPVRSSFGYLGSKRRIAKRIIQIMPPHNAWVEAFCGSAALTLAKPAAQIEIINDLDNNIVNLFQQLRTNKEALCEAIELTPYAHGEFELCRDSICNCDDISNPLEQARKFLVASMMTVNGITGGSGSGFSTSPSYTRGNKEARVNRWYNFPSRLAKIAERLKTVRIENRDAREIVTMFENRPATLMYLDPPYYMTRNHGYLTDAKTKEFHKELLELCLKAKCMIIISGYNNGLYSSILQEERGWEKIQIETHTRDTKGIDYARTEILWGNSHFVKAKQNNRVPIRLSKKEKKQRKVNPARR